MFSEGSGSVMEAARELREIDCLKDSLTKRASMLREALPYIGERHLHNVAATVVDGTIELNQEPCARCELKARIEAELESKP